MNKEATPKVNWIKFNPDDWLDGNKFLTLEERGLYISLISEMYKAGKAITADYNKLILLFGGISKKKFTRLLDGLISAGKIFITADNMLWNNKVAKELEDSKNYLNKQKENGIKGAEAKKQRMVKGGYSDPTSTAEANNNNNNNNKKPNTKVFVKKAKIPPDDFNIFWEEYPHKVGKSVAIKAYSLARETASCDVILDGLRRYKQSKPESYQWLNPSTFLNQKRWEDEPAKVINLPVTSWNNDHKRQAETVKDMDFSKVFTDFGQKEQVNATG
ncbi:DUF1376 domain-containing protein [Bartonella sp. DGB1]|uniref:DUF1376 domain-containing protein n=1 Tax=Bartonella sp. DGB1 TaxID=3239807 RepID=UPI003523C37F